MTSLEDFHVALKSNPHDFVLMGMYADFLEGECGPVTCMRCNGRGCEKVVKKVLDPLTWDSLTPCQQCGGSGSINSQLAEGYRALATIRPVYDVERGCWWGWQSAMPSEWYAAAVSRGKGDNTHVSFDDALKALDAAALAWASLSPKNKEVILCNGPWAQGVK